MTDSITAAVRAIFATKEVATLCRALASAPGKRETLRLVGGAVRDLHLGREPKDLDFATTLTPSEIAVACERCNIRIGGVANGRAVAHGTTIAQVGDRIFEITTLRLDAATDGRHAEVRFTRAWEEDSARRDFTINALYAGQDGTIYDYHGGLADLEARRLRFIGRAADRVAEDALRVLRFFRFHAELDWPHRYADAGSTLACAAAAEAGDLAQVSGERMWAEFSRILAVPSGKVCRKVLERMEVANVLGAVLGKELDLRIGWADTLKAYDGLHSSLTGALKAALTAEGLDTSPKQMALARLALLLSGEPGVPYGSQARFGLSRMERATMSFGLPLGSVPQWGMLCQSYYNYGTASGDTYAVTATIARRRALMAARMQCALGKSDFRPISYREFVRAALSWVHRPFHLTAEDLRGLGVADGEEMGEILRIVRDWWATRDRKPNHAACLMQAKSELSMRRRESYWNTQRED